MEVLEKIKINSEAQQLHKWIIAPQLGRSGEREMKGMEKKCLFNRIG